MQHIYKISQRQKLTKHDENNNEGATIHNLRITLVKT